MSNYHERKSHHVIMYAEHKKMFVSYYIIQEFQ